MAAFKEISMSIAETIALCKEILTEHYGVQFRGLLLYGSTARGQATPGTVRTAPRRDSV